MTVQLNGASAQSETEKPTQLGDQIEPLILDCKSGVDTELTKSQELKNLDSVESNDVKPPDGGYGWVVVFSALMVNLIGGFADVYGVFYMDLLEYFGASNAATAWPGGICMALILGAGPLASLICHRFSHRTACIWGGIIGAIGFLTSAFATNLYIMYLTFGIVAGFGFCLQYLSASMLTGYYFTKRRNLAMCIGLSGVCMGDFVVAPLVEYLNEHYTWRGAMIIAAGFSLNACVFGALMKPLPGISTHNDKPNCDTTILRKPMFLLFCAGESLWSIAFAVFLTISPDIAYSVGLSKIQGSFLISVMGVASASSRIVIGLAGNSNKCDRVLIYAVSVILSVAPLVALGYSSNYNVLLAVSVLYGMGYGVEAGISPVILADLFGLENLTAAYGYLTLADGATSLLGPPIAGWLFDITGNWRASCWFIAGTTMAGAVACFALKVAVVKQTSLSLETDDCRRHSNADSNHDDTTERSIIHESKDVSSCNHENDEIMIKNNDFGRHHDNRIGQSTPKLRIIENITSETVT